MALTSAMENAIKSHGLNVVHPHEFDNKVFPVAMFVHKETSFIGSMIDVITQSNWNHVCWIISNDVVASQEVSGYKRIPLNTFIGKSYRLKFCTFKSKIVRNKLSEKINNDLTGYEQLPQWKKVLYGYDFLGILGQVLRCPWIQLPWKWFCSERFADDINKCTNVRIPKRADPGDCSEILDKSNDIFKLGYYFED